ncbi:MAG: copper transporter [Corynebacterium sp.]|uniref:copper transporter n=1 Tax=Corynebacterium sp. TaxID=1720 RepID=UPI0026DD16EF|nr:copper transporter [Corynebacterium sp.]MDO4761883.1 copper transporter [Corynebacterium sp.]
MKKGRGSTLFSGLTVGVAVGIVAGTFVLAPNLPGGSTQQVEVLTKERDRAREDVDIALAQATSADSIVSSFAGSAINDVLKDLSVVVLHSADADAKDVDDLREMVKSAGAKDAGVIALKRNFFHQDGADSLKNTVALTLPAGAQLSENKLDPGTHAGEALQAALLKKESQEGSEEKKSAASPEDRAIVLGALKEAGFVDYTDGSVTEADAVIMVVGDEHGTKGNNFVPTTQVAFVEALASKGDPVVVAGRVRTAAETGVIGLIRGDETLREKVSTVDSVNRMWGQMATVLALKEKVDGGSGAYGAAASADAASPAPKVG